MKKNNIISLLFIVFALLCSVPSSASYMFKHYGVESGLSQSTVFALLQEPHWLYMGRYKVGFKPF